MYILHVLTDLFHSEFKKLIKLAVRLRFQPVSQSKITHICCQDSKHMVGSLIESGIIVLFSWNLRHTRGYVPMSHINTQHPSVCKVRSGGHWCCARPHSLINRACETTTWYCISISRTDLWHDAKNISNKKERYTSTLALGNTVT